MCRLKCVSMFRLSSLQEMGSDSYFEDESKKRRGCLPNPYAGTISDLAMWVEKVKTGKFPKINESVVMKTPGDRETSVGQMQVLQDNHPWEKVGKVQVAMSENALEMR